MILKYVNSRGRTFDLTANSLVRIKDGNFHSYGWTYEGVAQRFGVDVSSFSKKPYEYSAVLEFRGTVEERKALIDSFHDAIEYDVMMKREGTLFWSDYYIKCYISETDTYPDDKSFRTLNEIVIFCPYPFWIKEEKTQFFKSSQLGATSGLDFPFDFEFDFADSMSGNGIMVVSHHLPSDFKMDIYGPCANPLVTIKGYPYQVFCILGENEYLSIDSRQNTVVKYSVNGVQTNMYNSRRFEPSIFEKIPPGLFTVNWSGEFGFDITVFKERSEPCFVTVSK